MLLVMNIVSVRDGGRRRGRHTVGKGAKSAQVTKSAPINDGSQEPFMRMYQEKTDEQFEGIPLISQPMERLRGYDVLDCFFAQARWLARAVLQLHSFLKD